MSLKRPIGRRHSALAALLILAALLLGACELHRIESTEPLPEPEAPAAEPERPAAPERAQEPDRLSPEEASQGQAEAALAAPEIAAPEPVAIDPEKLLGLDQASLEALLGVPSFAREEPPGRVWQYYGEACVLDLFLYPDEREDTYRAVYYELRERTSLASAEPECLGKLPTPSESP